MKILVVEDEPSIASSLKSLLEKQKYNVELATSISYAKRFIDFSQYDVVLLDRMLPDGDGVELIKFFLAREQQCRFIILSALGDINDKVVGLDLGADDYLVKPFEPEELLARIRASVRRPVPEYKKSYEIGNISFIAETRTAFIDSEALPLSSKELLVFEVLIKAKGRIVTHEAMEQFVYSLDDEIQSNTLASHISRLRKQLDKKGANVEIYAARGIGYLLREK